MKTESLNYCRQMTRQFLTFLDIPSLPEKQSLMIRHALDLCRASQKFSLPDGGRLFQDNELRALNESEPLRLPHPFIALEYHPTGENEDWATELSTRRIIFCRESDDGIVITPACFSDADGVWALLGDCFVPSTNYLVREDSLDGRPFVKSRFPPNEDPRDYMDEIGTALAFLNALQCSNVRIERTESRKSRKKVKSALPFDVYHVLTIDIGRSERASAGPGGADHRSPREHLRRGHIVRPEGRRPYWRNATVVNAGRGTGKITKDYALKAAA